MLHKLFLKTDFIPSFLIALIVDKTSSLINKFFAFDISAVYQLVLDKWQHKKNIWQSKFTMNPGKYGYTFPKSDNSFYWVNNKGLSLDDAIRIRNTYNNS